MSGRCFAVAVLLAFLFSGCQKAPPDPSAVIRASEARIDSVLAQYEQKGELEEALEHYQAVVNDILGLELPPTSPHYREQQRVLAYAFLRSGNMLRQLGRTEEAVRAGERELECARGSGDEMTLARALISFGSTLVATGDVDRGLSYIEEARRLFERGDSFDYKQGLGWYWILQSDLALADLIEATPGEIIAFADNALELLLPIENWPGVARAYAVRARAHEESGASEAAANDRLQQMKYEALIGTASEQ